MILDKEVEIKTNPFTYSYYISLGYKFKCGDKIFIKIDDLQKNSHLFVNVKCDICGKESLIRFQIYNTSFVNGNVYNCKSCSFKKAKSTMFKKYGTEYALQNESIKEKQENTCLKKLGFKNASQNIDIKNKKIETVFKNYGVNNPSHIFDYVDKVKKTKLKKYGDENYTNREKAKETCLINFGCENPSQSSIIKAKKEDTCMKNYGVKSPMQDPGIFKRAQKSSSQIFQYKDTNLTYQAGYEKYFLELMDNYGFINELSMGKSYNYLFEGKHHVYYSDYLFRGTTIEAKSTWFYNKNGKNIKNGLQNEAKWQAVENSGDELVVLFSKKEIRNYVENLF